MEPNTMNNPYSNTPMQSPASFGGGPSKNRKLLLIAGGAIVLLVIILVSVLLIGGKREKGTSSDQSSNKSTQLTIGSKPYIYSCSVATTADFKAAFALTGPDTINSVTDQSARIEANAAGETDLTKLAPQSKSSDYTSDCRLSTTASASATGPVSISVEVKQYREDQYAKTFLEGQKRFALPSGSTDTSSLPKLASFPSNSFVKLPNAQGAAHTIGAIVQQGNTALRVEYMMGDNETTEVTLPKIDAFMKAVAQKAADSKVASAAPAFDGHATMINQPFVETCHGANLTSVAKQLSNIELRVDEVSSINQFGALSGSSAAGDGVASICQAYFNTSEERSKASESTSSSSSDIKKRYPHTLSLKTNRYASNAEAKAAFEAQKTRLTRLSYTLQALGGIADDGYKASKQNEVPDFSIDGTGKRTLLEDSYVLLKGATIVTVSTQQSKSSKTAPANITTDQIQKVYSRFKDLLSLK